MGDAIERAYDTFYISIGNTDNKLTQREWGNFCRDVFRVISDYTMVLHGIWFSLPDSEFQNACWCVARLGNDPGYKQEEILTRRLAVLAKKYRQDGIAWAEAKTTFINPTGD